MVRENENRREALKKIGMALAAVAAAGKAGLSAQLQRPQRLGQPLKLPIDILSVVNQRSGDFDVFVAHNGADASAFVINAADTKNSAQLVKTLGANPAKATIINGVVHINVGAAAGRSSVRNEGMIDFRGATLTRNVQLAR